MTQQDTDMPSASSAGAPANIAKSGLATILLRKQVINMSLDMYDVERDIQSNQPVRVVNHTENRCAKCEAVFTRWSEYYQHRITVKCAKVIRPVKTTGRIKIEIVKDFE